MDAKVELFGLDFSVLTYQGAVEALAAAAARDDGRAQVIVPTNVDCLVRLEAIPEFKANHYARADFILADGMPVVWASRLCNRPLPERVTGADLFVSMCQRAQQEGWQVVVLGGDPAIDAHIHDDFARVFPGLKVEVVSPPMGYDPEGPLAEEHARQIRALAPRIIFACLGMPKQEKWAFRYAPTMPGGIILCAGMAMRFALGLQTRAPLWMQRAGLEWVWRMGSEPRRLVRRYLYDDRKFIGMLWRQWRKR